MAGVELALLVLGSIIFLGFLASVVFERFKIPDVILLLLVGLLIGPVFGIVNSADFVSLASILGTLALIVVVFDGGLHLDLFTILREIPNAALFSTVVFIGGALLVGGLLHFVFGWPFLHALLLGVIAGGTGSNEVLPIVQRLSVSEKTKVLVSLDALINDVLTFVFIFALLEVVSTGSFSVSESAGSIASAFSIGVVAGLVLGLFWLGILKKFSGKPLGYMITLGMMFVLYAGINFIGGSGAIAVLVFSLVLGNSVFLAGFLKWKGDFKLDDSIKTTQKEVSFFVRTFYFVYLGLLFSPKFFTVPVMAVSLVALAGFFAARYAGTMVLNAVDYSYKKYSTVIATMLPRGLISTVVLFLPAERGVSIPFLVETVFILVLLSNVVTVAGSFAFERNAPSKEKPQVVAVKPYEKNR